MNFEKSSKMAKYILKTFTNIGCNLETNYCKNLLCYSRQKDEIIDVYLHNTYHLLKKYILESFLKLLNWTNLADCCTNNHIQKAAERNSFVFYKSICVCFFKKEHFNKWLNLSVMWYDCRVWGSFRTSHFIGPWRNSVTNQKLKL